LTTRKGCGMILGLLGKQTVAIATFGGPGLSRPDVVSGYLNV